MALPVYYLNQSWSQTYGEETNHIVTRAFSIFMSVIYEFKNKETKNRMQTKDEFMASSTDLVLKKLFESVLIHSYTRDADTDNSKKASVINSLSFQLSPYVKMLPRFDAIPVIISCMRQNDLHVVKMAVETLTLLCQWNHSFVKTITDYMFSSTIFTLLNRLYFNIKNSITVNHYSKTKTKTKSKTTLLQRIRNTASSFSIDSVDEEEGKRNVFLLDTEDVFFQDLSCTDAIQDLISCSEEQGQEEVLMAVFVLLLSMEGAQSIHSSPSELVTELHALECESLLMDFLYLYIQQKNENMIECILSVLLLLFQYFQNYSLFTNLTNEQKSLLLKCLKMKRKSIYEQLLTVVLISILHTNDTLWFHQDAFTDSILQHYRNVSTTTQILISICFLF